jgi:hypothetical protein
VRVVRPDANAPQVHDPKAVPKRVNVNQRAHAMATSQPKFVAKVIVRLRAL